MTVLQLFTLFHTLLSVVALIAGLLVVKGLIFASGRQLWTLLFLVTAAATTLTGFIFPFNGLTPALILGVISILPITLAFIARYRYRLKEPWRGTYIISVVVTFYFNCFVLVVQAFRNIPSLQALAPTEKELPFLFAHLATLVLCIQAGIVAFKRYHPNLFKREFSTAYISPRAEVE